MFTEEQLKYYADKGLSVTETAFKMEKERSSVSRYAKKYGIEFVNKKPKLSKETTTKIRQMISYGKTDIEVSEALNISIITVYRHRRKMNGDKPRKRKKAHITVENDVKSVKVRELDLKLGDEFEVIREYRRKDNSETFIVIQLTGDLIVGRNSKGLVESFQVKEYEYGLM